MASVAVRSQSRTGASGARRPSRRAPSKRHTSAFSALPCNSNALVHCQLALLSEGHGEIAEAAAHYTEALRVDAKMADAARRLSGLIARGGPPANVPFNPLGLKAALDHDFCNRDQVAEATIYYLAQRAPLADALAAGRRDGWLAAARQQCRKGAGPLLRDELLQKALRDTVIRHPDLERLLTALRHVLLVETPPEAFEDRALLAFASSLANQCWFNEYVWPVSAEERAYLDAHPVDVAALLAGQPAQGVRFILNALYAAPGEILDPASTVSRIKPQIVRDFAKQFCDEAVEQAGCPQPCRASVLSTIRSHNGSPSSIRSIRIRAGGALVRRCGRESGKSTSAAISRQIGWRSWDGRSKF